MTLICMGKRRLCGYRHQYYRLNSPPGFSVPRGMRASAGDLAAHQKQAKMICKRCVPVLACADAEDADLLPLR